MLRRSLLLFSLSFVISALAPLSLKAQTGPVHWKDNRVPFPLLPGYRITGSAGVEGDLHGKIWRDDGTTIRYDIDLDAADDAGSMPKEPQLWRQSQTVGENNFVCVYTRSDELVVRVSGRYIANCHAKIQSQKDLAELLLTILTLDPGHGYPTDTSMMIDDPQQPTN
jgi:hypothetical protein